MFSLLCYTPPSILPARSHPCGPASIRGGTLLPRQVFPGKTSITVRLDKIRLKDANTYIEPFYTITVKGSFVGCGAGRKKLGAPRGEIFVFVGGGIGKHFLCLLFCCCDRRHGQRLVQAAEHCADQPQGR